MHHLNQGLFEISPSGVTLGDLEVEFYAEIFQKGLHFMVQKRDCNCKQEFSFRT